MRELKQQLIKLVTDERGQDLIEYGLMASLIGLGVMAGLRGMKTSVGTAFTQISTTLTSSV